MSIYFDEFIKSINTYLKENPKSYLDSIDPNGHLPTIHPEHLKALNEGRRNSRNSPEHNSRISQVHKNKIVSEETRLKSSISHKGQVSGFKNKNHNINTKLKISQTVKSIDYGTKTCPICGRIGKVPSIGNHIKKCERENN